MHKTAMAMTLALLPGLMAQTAAASELFNYYCAQPSHETNIKVEMDTPLQVIPKAGAMNLLVKPVPEQQAEFVALLTRQFEIDKTCAEFLMTGAQLEGGKTELLARVYFDFDSEHLTPDSRAVLDRIIKRAEQNQVKFALQGHTDNSGSQDYNFSLGLKRADSVQRFMVAGGVSSERMEIASAGESQPLDDNATAAGREANRRVEIKAAQ